MNTWNSAIFDCFNDYGICFYGCCCTPCLYGENAQRIDGSSCCNSGCLWYLMSGWGLCCLIHMGKRKALRDRFDLQEDCNDCVATTFCAPCAICQEARELKSRLNPSEGSVVVVQPVAANYNSFGQSGMSKQG